MKRLYLMATLLLAILLSGCSGGNIDNGGDPVGPKPTVYLTVAPNPVYVQQDPSAPRPMVAITWRIENATYWYSNFAVRMDPVGSTAQAWMYYDGSHEYYVFASNENGSTRASVTVVGVYLPY